MLLADAFKLCRSEMDRWGLRSVYRLRFVQRLEFNVVAECDRSAAVIRFSAPYIRTHDESVVLDWCRHEIAHAFTADGHGEMWRRMFLAIGGSGQQVTFGGRLLSERIVTPRRKRQTYHRLYEASS